MDPKDIKSELKKAREAIRDKDFKAALKHCKTILKNDGDNYNAWVFLGVAAQETNHLEQAEASFEKAIELSPEQILAWQGLCNFYEKKEDSAKHMDCLVQLTKRLNNDKVKQKETVDKFISLAKTLDNYEKVFEGLELKSSVNEDSIGEQFETWRRFFTETCQDDNRNPKMRTVWEKVVIKLADSPEFSEESCKSIITDCISPVYKDGMYDEARGLVQIIYARNQTSASCIEFLLKTSLEAYIRDGTVIDCKEEMLCTAEKGGISPSLCKILRGVQFLSSKKYTDALQELSEAVRRRNKCVEGWYILAKVQLLLHLNMQAENSAKAGLRVSENSSASSDLIGNLHLLVGKALAARQNWEASLKALEKSMECMGHKPNILIAFCFTLLEMGKVDQAQKMYSDLYSCVSDEALKLQLEGYLHMLRKEYAAALQKLKQSVSVKDSAFTIHLIGRVLWKTDQVEKAEKVFVKAAELDPFFAKNFLYLGHYYMKFECNKRKARKCYQKAFDLNSTSEETGISLCNVLKAVGDHEANLSVLAKVTEQASLGSCKWAWTQLGLYQFERNNFTKAIFSLQNAVRADPLSSYAWECLGDAYLKRGSYESALKAYEKAAELNPKAMYPLYQVSTIQKARSMYEDAVDRYKKLLELDSFYIPALIGLAEALLLFGKKLYEECIFGRARDCFQEGLNVLSRVASVNASFSCLWKLAGDACTFSFGLGEEWFPIAVPSALMNVDGDPVLCHKRELLSFGARFYGQALTLKDCLSNLWHDLGINYYFQSKLADQESANFAKKALICLQKAVSLSPTRHEHWTTLGVIAVGKEIQDFALGQHAFIKSIEMENNNVEAWTNLGIVYLENENIKLAHSAFNVAQSLDPTFPLCWIGLAIIARKVNSQETIDLYRHATTLGSHPEAILGYGQTVCEALLDMSNRKTELYRYNIEEMDALSVASDCMTKYTANEARCPEALNILGMLLERQKLCNGALKAYQRSTELFESLGKTDELEKVRTNFARLLRITNQHFEAISEYVKFVKADSSLLCSFALAVYKSKDHKKTLEIFDKALKMTQISSDRSHILVAMAMVAWNFQRPVASQASTLLLKSVKIQPPSIFGLLALYAVGIMEKQATLTTAVQNGLLHFKDHPEHSSSIALLNATQSCIKECAKSARSHFLKSVHIHPTNHVMWIQAATSLLQWDSSYASLASVCSRIAILHGGDKELSSQIFALSCLAVGYKHLSLHAAQKAVHIHPDKISNWVTLAAASHISSKDRKCTDTILNFVERLAIEQDARLDLRVWIMCMNVFRNMLCKDVKAATQQIKQIVNLNVPSAKIQGIIQVLAACTSVLGNEEKLDYLVAAVKNNPLNFLGWQFLVKFLIRSGKLSEAEKTLTNLATIAMKYFPKLKAYPLLQLAALSYQAMHTTDENEKWAKLATASVSEAVKFSPDNQAARFLQGLISVKTGNLSLARRSLEKVLCGRVMAEPKWMENVALQLLLPIYVKKNDGDALQKLVDDELLKEEDMKTLLSSALNE